jgi:hypothetical protein
VLNQFWLFQLGENGDIKGEGEHPLVERFAEWVQGVFTAEVLADQADVDVGACLLGASMPCRIMFMTPMT